VAHERDALPLARKAELLPAAVHALRPRGRQGLRVDHRDVAVGSFDSSTVGFIGSFEPVTFTATIIWAGGTLRESLFVDCSKPALKEDCKNGGWRNYAQFKNEGQCIAFVSGGKS
jgi:hypothetical protein